MDQIQPQDHVGYMRQALDMARKSPPKPTNFRVGAVLVNTISNEILATGYTLELPGNTHAEQCCFMKLAEQHRVPEESLAAVLPADMQKTMVLYTTMEPCWKRLSGNMPCVERIRRLAPFIKTVYVGVNEPEKFVRQSGNKTLQDAGVDVIHVPGLEKDILETATAGHQES